MEMQQVRYCVALCETLNFTRAAEKCNVTQPSLTRAIKLLEDELGGALFNRERNHTHLTDLGRHIEPHLRQVMLAIEGARAQAGAFVKLEAPELRLGIARGIPLVLLVESIGRFSWAHPGAEIILQSGEPDELLETLRRGDLEVVVVPHEPAELDDLHYFRLADDAPQVVMPKGHRLGELDFVPAAELAREAVVSVNRCGYWRAVARQLEAAGLPARPRLVVDRVQWLLDVVRGGLGVGLVSSHRALGEGLVGRPLQDPPTALEVTLATKRGRLYSPPVRAFVEIAIASRRAQHATASLPG
jgi:LysR family hydrogen peroxide-inducible transcriptional activator